MIPFHPLSLRASFAAGEMQSAIHGADVCATPYRDMFYQWMLPAPHRALVAARGGGDEDGDEDGDGRAEETSELHRCEAREPVPRHAAVVGQYLPPRSDVQRRCRCARRVPHVSRVERRKPRVESCREPDARLISTVACTLRVRVRGRGQEAG